MQIAVITGPDYSKARIGVLKANDSGMDGVEIRLDMFDEIIIDEIKNLMNLIQGKVILTLRSKDQGGSFVGTRDEQKDIIKDLLTLGSDYLDVEFPISSSFGAEMDKQKHPECKIISSWHNYQYTPKNLDLILSSMMCDGIYAYKICTSAQNISDSYRMLSFIQRAAKNKDVKIIGLCMGFYGKTTRSEGIKAGNYLNYQMLNTRDRRKPPVFA